MSAEQNRASDFARSLKLPEAMSDRPVGYVGQDFGELSRVAVLETGLRRRAECWSNGELESWSSGVMRLSSEAATHDSLEGEALGRRTISI
jgi:hypothetical protein